ncbi:MAG: twin-arginine translocase subunit TatC [Candidatus Omnitrophota bacterium]|jgi:sec-independent protein translocase protein TatC
MSAFYPEETKKLDVVSHLEELRKRILICLAVFAAASVLAFVKGETIMIAMRRPLEGLVAELIFIGPTEAFVSFVKIALLAGFVVSFPVILYHAWAFLSPAVPKDARRHVAVWLVFALVFFFSGIAFSYFVAIPLALNFLINFGREWAEAKITLGKYISFIGALILIGGVIFEIPIVMGLLTDTGILRTKVLRKKRHYAVLAILVFAAVITPTQDIMNMLLFAVPMIALYEAGLVISKFIENRKRSE